MTLSPGIGTMRLPSRRPSAPLLLVLGVLAAALLVVPTEADSAAMSRMQAEAVAQQRASVTKLHKDKDLVDELLEAIPLEQKSLDETRQKMAAAVAESRSRLDQLHESHFLFQTQKLDERRQRLMKDIEESNARLAELNARPSRHQSRDTGDDGGAQDGQDQQQQQQQQQQDNGETGADGGLDLGKEEEDAMAPLEENSNALKDSIKQIQDRLAQLDAADDKEILEDDSAILLQTGISSYTPAERQQDLLPADAPAEQDDEEEEEMMNEQPVRHHSAFGAMHRAAGRGPVSVSATSVTGPAFIAELEEPSVPPTMQQVSEPHSDATVLLEMDSTAPSTVQRDAEEGAGETVHRFSGLPQRLSFDIGSQGRLQCSCQYVPLADEAPLGGGTCAGLDASTAAAYAEKLIPWVPAPASADAPAMQPSTCFELCQEYSCAAEFRNKGFEAFRQCVLGCKTTCYSS